MGRFYPTKAQARAVRAAVMRVLNQKPYMKNFEIVNQVNAECGTHFKSLVNYTVPVAKRLKLNRRSAVMTRVYNTEAGRATQRAKAKKQERARAVRGSTFPSNGNGKYRIIATFTPTNSVDLIELANGIMELREKI